MFDQLATETILEIFEYLSSNDIIYAFFNLNQRLNSILLYQCCSNNFKTPTTNLNFWQNILFDIGSYIEHLIITTNDFNFSLNLFPNLKSIIISSVKPIEYDQLYSIIENKQFNQLISFKIKCQIFYKRKHLVEHRALEKTLLKKICHPDTSLEIFECSSELSLNVAENLDNLTVNINIYSLSLKLTYITDVFILLQYTPNLKYLNIILLPCDVIAEVLEKIDLSKIKLETLNITYTENKRDFYGIYRTIFRQLTNLIKKFSTSLISLSLNLRNIESNGFQFDGIYLQKQLLESIVQLKKFHFFIKLSHDPIEPKYLLSTFENQFWFDHHWSIGIHGRCIYTLPFHFNQLDEFIDFDLIQTNDLNSFNSSRTWYHVKSIELHRSDKFNLNLIEQIKIKMPNLISIHFNAYYHLQMRRNEIYPTLDSVLIVRFDGNSIEYIKEWIFYILPNLKHLILSPETKVTPIVDKRIEKLTITNSDGIYQSIESNYIGFSNLQHVEIEIVLNYQNTIYRSSNYITNILSNFKNVKIVIIQFYDAPNLPLETLSTMLLHLNLGEILKHYRLKQCYNLLELIRKTE